MNNVQIAPLKTKQVIAIYRDGLFKQYLMKSEVRLLLDMMRDLGTIEIKITAIPIKEYNLVFGRN